MLHPRLPEVGGGLLTAVVLLAAPLPHLIFWPTHVSALAFPSSSSASAPDPQAAHPETQHWPAAWADRPFRLQLLAAVGLLLVAPRFYHYVQTRPGQLLTDPLLHWLPAHDVSGATFALIYGGIVATFGFLLRRPYLLARALWAYYLLQLLRMGTLWLLPLEPPADMLTLSDPVMDRIFGVTTQPIVRDLFFSGHTATATLLTLAVRGRAWRWALGLTTVAVGILVLVQRVHYSYDVLAAPLFGWAAYWLAGRVCRPKAPNA